MSSTTLANSIFANPALAKPLYFLPADDLVGEVLVPSFAESLNACSMMGFFSSEALSDLAPGLACFINRTNSTFKLIVSPFLSDIDRQAIESGLKTPADVANDFFEDLLVTTDLLQMHTLKCLAYLIQKNRIELKIAIMKNALFHPKVWLFESGEKTIAAHGSSNMTSSGIKRNFEQISVSMSWLDPIQKYIVNKLKEKFENLWDSRDDECIVVEASVAIKNNLLRKYGRDIPPSEKEFFDLYRSAKKAIGPQRTDIIEPVLPKRVNFSIPPWLQYNDGPFRHQGLAVDAWCSAGYRGVLEMATGSGKTITAMLCAYQLHNNFKPVLIIVAAPYLPLIEQWCDEIKIFGLSPENLTKVSGTQARNRILQQINRRLRTGSSDIEVIVVSHDTLCSHEFKQSITSFNYIKLLIADEAHNLGRNEFIHDTPDFIEYRLALSATPVRQYDDDGTAAIFAYFGKVVFRYTLKEAIGTCLVPYDYYVHPVYLTQVEMDAWYDITCQIKKNAWRSENGQIDERLAKLFRDRRKILETAENKIIALRALLEKEDLVNLKHTLIYCSDKEPEQLQVVNATLSEMGLLFHQLTSEETSQRERCKEIISSFQNGDLQILTAKRVLDEGVNIPQINKAYILASTTVERQWIQRRGRLLRTCKETNKTFSEIHDFFVLPPIDDKGLDEDATALIRSELQRIQEFASLARNAGRIDGPLPIIHEMVKKLFF